MTLLRIPVPGFPALHIPVLRFPVLGLMATLLLSACSNSTALDWDLRSGTGSLDTSDAALGTADARPSADQRGVISYPGYQVAEARRGDTVASLAARIGINADELARYNALRPDDTLRAGEIVALPGRVPAGGTGAVIGGGAGSVDVESIATTALDRVGTDSQPAARQGAAGEPVRHKVARGETAFSIARTYNVSAKSLADWNGLGPDLAVREGQFLIIPTVGASAPGLSDTAPGIGSPTPQPPSARKPLPDEEVAPASAKPQGTPASPDLGTERTSASSSRFAMPVEGRIIRGYVKKKNDGIDIAAPAGTVVKSAAAGTVAAVTKDTSGIPIIVIRHADGILTVYAGVDGVTLAKGAAVKRGQAIAVVRSGSPSFLHFEVRKGVDSVDPMPFLQ